MAYVADLLRDIWRRVTTARERWTVYERSTDTFTNAEKAAVERAFEKFEEGFQELDQAFKGWKPEPLVGWGDTREKSER